MNKIEKAILAVAEAMNRKAPASAEEVASVMPSCNYDDLLALYQEGYLAVSVDKNGKYRFSLMPKAQSYIEECRNRDKLNKNIEEIRLRLQKRDIPSIINMAVAVLTLLVTLIR